MIYVKYTIVLCHILLENTIKGKAQLFEEFDFAYESIRDTDRPLSECGKKYSIFDLSPFLDSHNPCC